MDKGCKPCAVGAGKLSTLGVGVVDHGEQKRSVVEMPLWVSCERRLGVDSNYASRYRLRLTQAELIEPAGYGKLAFTMPYLREYLLNHAATLGMGNAT